MHENKIGKMLYSIGLCTIILGILGSLICGGIFETATYDYSYLRGYDIEYTYNWVYAITGSVVSFISGMCFIGFSEIITLLQKNINKQDELIKNLQKPSQNVTNKSITSKNILEDIEANLPEI